MQDTETKPPPKVGEVVNGYRFKGGDPATQGSWEPEAPKAPKIPKQGDVVNGYQFTGGDPAAKGSWAAVSVKPPGLHFASAPSASASSVSPSSGGSGASMPSGSGPRNQGDTSAPFNINEYNIPAPADPNAPPESIKQVAAQVVAEDDKRLENEALDAFIKSRGGKDLIAQPPPQVPGAAQNPDLPQSPLEFVSDPRRVKMQADYDAYRSSDPEYVNKQREIRDRAAAGTLTPAMQIQEDLQVLEHQRKVLDGQRLLLERAAKDGTSIEALAYSAQEHDAMREFLAKEYEQLAARDPRSFADKAREEQQKLTDMRAEEEHVGRMPEGDMAKASLQSFKQGGAAVAGGAMAGGLRLADTKLGAFAVSPVLGVARLLMQDDNQTYTASDRFGEYIAEAHKNREANIASKYKGEMWTKEDGFNSESILPQLARGAGSMTALIGAGAAGRTGVFAAAYTSEYENYVQQAMADGASEKVAETGGLAYALAAAAIETTLNPQLFLANPALKTSFQKTLMNSLKEGVPVNQAVKVAMNGLKEAGEEVGTLASMKATNAVANQLAGTDLNTQVTSEELVNNTVLGFTLGAAARIAAIPSERKKMGEVSRAQAEALQWATMNPEASAALINEAQDMTPEQKAKTIEQVQYLSSVYKGNNLYDEDAKTAYGVAQNVVRKNELLKDQKENPTDKIIAEAGGDPRQAEIEKIDADNLQTLGLTLLEDEQTSKPTKTAATPQAPAVPQPSVEEGGVDAGGKADDVAPIGRIEPSLTQDIVDDADALAEAYYTESREWNSEANPDFVIFNALAGNVLQDSYDRFGDANKKGDSMGKTYFNKNGQTLDQIAQEVSGITGTEVTTNDLVSFMEGYPNGLPRRSPRMVEMDERYGALTGKRLIITTGAKLVKEMGMPSVKDPEVKEFIDGFTDDDGNVNWQAVKDNTKALSFLGYTDEQAAAISAEADRQLNPGGAEVLGAVPTDEGATGRGSKPAQGAGAPSLADRIEAAANKLEKDLRTVAGSFPIPPTILVGAMRAAAKVVRAGENIANAIKAAIAHIRDSQWYKDLSKADKSKAEKEVETQINAAINPTPERNGSDGVKKTVTTKRAYEGEFREEVKAELEKSGLFRDIENQEEAEARADAFIAKVGIDAALDATRNGDVRGGARSVIRVRALEAINQELMQETDEGRLKELAKEQSELIQEVSQVLLEQGREASMMARMYGKSELGFKSEVKAQEWEQQFGEKPPEEMLAKWKERDKEFEQLKQKLEEAEKRAQEAEEKATLAGIRDSLAREKVRGKTKQRKVVADRIRSLKIGKQGVAGSFIIPPQLFDLAIEVVATTYQAGEDIAIAISKGIDKIKESEWYKKLNKDDRDKAEGDFRNTVNEGTKDEIEEGPIRVPRQLIRDAVAQGANDINAVVTAVREEVIKQHPQATDRQIRDAITGYGREVNMTRDALSSEVNRVKRMGRTISALEDVRAKKQPVKAGKAREKLDAEEQRLKAQLRDELKALNFDPVAFEQKQEQSSLHAAKKRAQTRIEDIERRLKEGDFSKKPTKPVPEDKELHDLRTKRQMLEDEYEVEFEKERRRKRTMREKVYDGVMDVVNIPKSLLSSLDFSAPLRQGLVLSAGNPRAAGRATKEMFRQAFSQKNADEWLAALKQTDQYKLMKDSGLYLAEPTAMLTAREESFISNFAEKIPLVGRLIKGSGRAYAGYLNKLRADVFSYGANQMMDQGITPQSNPKAYEKWAGFINNATGRGELHSTIESATPLLNAMFFSPRFIASRFNLLNPVKYATMPKAARKLAMQNVVAFVGFYAVIAAILGAAGAEEEEDPRSSDFGKFKFGNTRYDMLGGFAQPIRFLAQLITGQAKKNGVIKELDGKKFPFETRADVALRFARTKLSPSAGIVADVLTGKDMVGKPVEWDAELMKAAIPLWMQDLDDAYKDGGASGVMTSAIPSIFGVGVQTYDNDKKQAR